MAMSLGIGLMIGGRTEQIAESLASVMVWSDGSYMVWSDGTYMIWGG